MSDNKKIQDAIATSVQGEVKEPVIEGTGSSGAMNMLFMLGASGALVPQWWSPARDAYLRKLITKSDHLAGALYNFSIKLRTIPLRIMAKNESIRSHVDLARAYENDIKVLSDFGKGFDVTFSKWIDDYHTQDNGAFLEIIADGPKDGAIKGRVIGIAHLDSAQCTRTSNPEYPVVYTDADSGKSYKLHRTRVVASSQRPSPKAGMHDVGYCSVSSILHSVQSLIDNQIYKEERVGSRPTEAIVITGGGLDPDDVRLAIELQRAEDTNSGLSKYSRAVLAGSRNIQDPKFEIHRLTEMPEWFNEKESTILSMAIVAMGFGMDARELFPAIEGSTKADAIISHIKQRGKGPGHVLSVMEHILNVWVLPSFLYARFDYQDDSEDRQRAEIINVRAQSRERDLLIDVINRRVIRQNMLHEGEITRSQFEDLELEDGRLPNGVEVITLFESQDQDYINWIGGANESNWEDKKKEINKFLINSRDEQMIIKARRALAALKYKYSPPEEEGRHLRTRTTRYQENQKPVGTDDSYEDERYGRKLPKPVETVDDETQRYQENNLSE